MPLLVIGIDCGITGAIACQTPHGATVVDVPTSLKGDGTGKVKYEVNASAVAEILKSMTAGYKDEAMVVLERLTGRPMIIGGKKIPTPASSMFSTGDSYGALRAVPAAIGLRVEYITAHAWKKHYDLPGGKQNKELARARAIQLFPGAPLDRVKDHNRAEALLIARYGWEVLR